MKIKFNIHYVTQWGQSLYLLLNSQTDSESQAFVMECDERNQWSAELSVPQSETLISYQYALLEVDKNFIYEKAPIRTIELASNSPLNIYDQWHQVYGDSPFLSTVFVDCFFKRNKSAEFQFSKQSNLEFRLFCPQVEPNQYIAILGNQDALGNWSVDKKMRMDESQFPYWKVSIDTSEFNSSLEYKYLLVDAISNEIIDWEFGDNRSIQQLDFSAFNLINDDHFKRTLPSWRGAGVAIPIFSLRSDEGFGVGEFNDLKKMVDWAKKTNQRIIQTLPINDTILSHTNADSYPYNALSVYALHPIYLNLDRLGVLKDNKLNTYFEDKKRLFNSKPNLEYQELMTDKWIYFKAIYEQEGQSVFATADYKKFFEANEEWLVPYAAFCFLRDNNKSPFVGQWEKYNSYNKFEIENLSSPNSEFHSEIALHYFLQYHLHLQLVDAHDYARANGIVIKGDIPIGVSPLSVDAWMHPNLFNIQVQAGAPPDDFSITGQNWGFPTYNWELMEKDGYQWWRKRFQKLAEYFDAYRIDHILGFFRIWEIPKDAVWGLLGCFNPALPLSPADLLKKGLKWDEQRFLKPYITDKMLVDLFDEQADQVIKEFLLVDGRGSFKFKSHYDTQRKIEQYFSGVEMDARQASIRDGLYSLLCEVLFIPDRNEPGKYHPRISMERSSTYLDLPIEIRESLKEIYVDFYYHRHDVYWKEQALKKLPALISATKMLVCGEDLGMVPHSVPDVMQALDILSLEIQRMPKKENVEFGLPFEAPYLSVCTTSSHDLSPLRAWWEENVDSTQRYYNQVLGLEGVAPRSCNPFIIQQIIEQHLHSNAQWVVLPWQDWMALDTDLRLQDPNAERINVPSNPNNFWCYRMHVTLEQLLKEHEFNSKISDLIKIAGR
jgi:4-alpha-glucanotransferase